MGGESTRSLVVTRSRSQRGGVRRAGKVPRVSNEPADASKSADMAAAPAAGGTGCSADGATRSEGLRGCSADGATPGRRVSLWQRIALIALAIGTAVSFPIALAVTKALSFDQRVPGPSGAYALRGTLPWSDAFDYWSAAQHLLQHGVLDEWGSRRPLNGAFLSARLWLANDHLLAALLIQSFAIGVVVAACVLVVARRMGLASACISALLLVAVGAIVQSTLQSEGLGLLLGAAALALLLHSVRGRGPRGVSMSSRAKESEKRAPAADHTRCSSTSLIAGGIGLALLSIAMAVRPGAVFMLLALGVWLIWRHCARWLRATIVAVIALAAGSAADRTARTLYASPSASGNANFVTTVLGLARGTDYYEADRWLHDTHPHERREAVLAREASAESMRLLRTTPGTFVGSLVRNEVHFITRLWPVLLLALIGVMRAPREERGLWLMGWLGIVASTPVIFGDGGIRVLAATWPFMIVSAASALRCRTIVVAGAATPARDRTENVSAVVAGVGAVAVTLFALGGPLLARALGAAARIPPPNTVGNDPFPRGGADEVDWVRGRPAFHALLVLGVDDPLDIRSRFAISGITPWVRLDELMRERAVIEFGEPLDQVPTPFLLCVVYDIDQSRARVFTLPLNDATSDALVPRFGTEPNAQRVHGHPIRIDSRPLRPGGRVRSGILGAPES